MAMPDAVPSRRRLWGTLLRVTVSVGLLALLVNEIDFDNLVPSHRSLAGTLAFLITGVALMALTIVVGARRWQLILQAFDAYVPMRRLVGHNFAGQFVGNVLPSTIGGDVLRVARSVKDVGGDTAFASVVLDRFTGFVSLPVLIVAGFLARPSLFGVQNSWIALLCAGGTVAVFGVILFVAGHPNLGGRFQEHENWMRYIGILHQGIDQMRRRPRLACATLAVAVGYQLIYTAAVYCAVHAVGLSTIPTAAVVAYVPAVAIAQVVPISVAGFGLREGMLVLLFKPLGATTGQAVAVGLLWFAMVLLASLGGAPLVAIGDRRRVPAGGTA
jgi:uncharacterized protein (TIRG00374 family)